MDYSKGIDNFKGYRKLIYDQGHKDNNVRSDGYKAIKTVEVVLLTLFGNIFARPSE
jgi:hypothetical protein